MTIDERIQAQDAPTVRVPPRVRVGSREERIWLADLIREACGSAERAGAVRPRAQYVVGYLLSRAALDESEALRLLDEVSITEQAWRTVRGWR